MELLQVLVVFTSRSSSFAYHLIGELKRRHLGIRASVEARIARTDQFLDLPSTWDILVNWDVFATMYVKLA